MNLTTCFIQILLSVLPIIQYQKAAQKSTK